MVNAENAEVAEMDTGMSLFDYAESQRQAEAGIAAAAENNAVLLAEAREIAVELSKGLTGRIGSVTVDADMVQRVMSQRYGRDVLGNAAGGIFRSRDWSFAGYSKSTRIQSHGNRLCKWTYIGGSK